MFADIAPSAMFGSCSNPQTSPLPPFWQVFSSGEGFIARLRQLSCGPENGVREDTLVARIPPDRSLMSERRVEYKPLAVRSSPGERPTIESLMHTAHAKIHRALVEAQQHA